MTNYSSQLNLWGDTGEAPPSGYSYTEGEQPVDAWDNFVTFHLIDDVTNHLIPLTNSRLDSSQGSDWSERPQGSTRDGHIFYAEDNGIMEFWHQGSSQWYELYHEGRDGPGSGLNADMVDGIQGDNLFQDVAMWQRRTARLPAAGDQVIDTYDDFDYMVPYKVQIFTTSSDARGLVHFTAESGNSASYSNSGSTWSYNEFEALNGEQIDEVQFVFDNSEASSPEEIVVEAYGFYVD